MLHFIESLRFQGDIFGGKIQTLFLFFQDGGGGMLTPPDKLNGDHHSAHWASGGSSLAMTGSMQTPPSSPPMSIERFG